MRWKDWRIANSDGDSMTLILLMLLQVVTDPLNICTAKYTNLPCAQESAPASVAAVIPTTTFGVEWDSNPVGDNVTGYVVYIRQTSQLPALRETFVLPKQLSFRYDRALADVSFTVQVTAYRILTMAPSVKPKPPGKPVLRPGLTEVR